ncbi:MAG: hypothetical protein LBT00_15555 [Spirochaetaceae bacterium]|jgi:hypothetical protein|nr:hypothetical protein [Spirochaetaceae bacterium]
MTSAKGKISTVVICACYLYLLITNLSEQLNAPKKIIGMIVFALVITSLFISNIAKTIYISKEKLDVIGFVVGMVFVVIIGFCYIVEHKKIRSAKGITKLEAFIDESMVVNLQGKTGPFIHVLLITMIAFGLFSKLSLFSEIIGILASIFGPKILEMLNDGSLFGKIAGIKKSG